MSGQHTPAFGRPAGRTLAAGALVGAASGLRSQMGVAVAVRRLTPTELPTFLRSAAARRAAIFAASSELVVDKLPQAPSRLAPPGLTARLVLGGAAGALLAIDSGWEGRLLAAVAGAAAAAVAAKLGHDLRAKIDQRLPDLAVAPIEDAVSLALAVGATRLATS
jgi:uncharacterized membrane protein